MSTRSGCVVSGPEPRQDLVGLSGYHSPQVSVAVRLNTNESPFAPPDGFAAALKEQIDQLALNRYPDRAAIKLREAIARRERAELEQVFCANGSNEVLQSLLLAFGGAGRTALVFEPTYALHSHIARITGTTVATERRDEEFRLSPEQVSESIERNRPSVTFLCSPNNPTGLSEPVEVVEAALASSAGLVVVDEAYGQFAPHSAAEVDPGFAGGRLVVVKTFSKTWALAGVRLGFALASEAVVGACELVALPYHLSSLTQAAGMAALLDEGAMDQNVEALKAERDRVFESLQGSEVKVWPSDANFILFRPLARGGHDVWQELVERSVLVRDCSSWRGLEGCLRVTIGTKDENDRFLEALKEVL
jgi:histidinol-phosphate aminotransferase